METELHKLTRPDAKGRITLGKLADGVSSFRISVDKKQRIILEPFIEIPAREKWLHNNKAAMAAVTRGIEQAAKKKVKKLGNFSAYADDAID